MDADINLQAVLDSLNNAATDTGKSLYQAGSAFKNRFAPDVPEQLASKAVDLGDLEGTGLGNILRTIETKIPSIWSALKNGTYLAGKAVGGLATSLAPTGVGLLGQASGVSSPETTGKIAGVSALLSLLGPLGKAASIPAAALGVGADYASNQLAQNIYGRTDGYLPDPTVNGMTAQEIRAERPSELKGGAAVESPVATNNAQAPEAVSDEKVGQPSETDNTPSKNAPPGMNLDVMLPRLMRADARIESLPLPPALKQSYRAEVAQHMANAGFKDPYVASAYVSGGIQGVTQLMTRQQQLALKPTVGQQIAMKLVPTIASTEAQQQARGDALAKMLQADFEQAPDKGKWMAEHNVAQTNGAFRRMTPLERIFPTLPYQATDKQGNPIGLNALQQYIQNTAHPYGINGGMNQQTRALQNVLTLLSSMHINPNERVDLGGMIPGAGNTQTEAAQ